MAKKSMTGPMAGGSRLLGRHPLADRFAEILTGAGIETAEHLEAMLGIGEAGEADADPAAQLLGLFEEEAEAEMVEPAILLPAELFLDTAGEDIRRRLFVTADAEGREMCLRPDFTIPVCRHYLAQGEAGRVANLAYFGPVFRQRPGETGEFLQAGIEMFGNDDPAAADADALRLAVEAVALFGVDDPQVRLGDEGLFTAVMEGLDLPLPWRRRLRAVFGDRARMDQAIARLAGSGAGSELVQHAGFLGAIAGANREAAQAVVEDLLAIAGIKAVGARTAHEIAERFLDQATLGGGGGLSAEKAGVLTRFLDIAGAPDVAADHLERFAREAGLTIDPAIDLFVRRNEALIDSGIDLRSLGFAADFGRHLDYYSGFIFEIRDPERGDDKPVVGGGRYDGLLERLGAGQPIPALGFSMWLDRLGVEGYGREGGRS
ncbi:ATP phosphoribosyltransferase regulatory subunit [Methyloraptor flagellatus]|uniref:ATP phosphoribosyltransferase regulatory subunit n=1 Tax=Methyloraptor flagellatus TaxID=3162530 RepID=A0AAU7X5J1_9HYPH